MATTPANATIQLSFDTGQNAETAFDGDVANSTAGPFTDPATSLSGTVTTTAVGPSGSVNTVTSGNGRLAINASGGGDTSDEFDPGESWSFKWNVPVEFAGIDFGSYSASGSTSDQFSISSPDWIGRTITPGTGVTFNSGTGTFVFNNTLVTDDNFTATNLGGAVPLTMGQSMTIAFTDANLSSGLSGSAYIESMSFNIVAAVPEATSAAFGALICGVIGAGSGIRKFWARRTKSGS